MKHLALPLSAIFLLFFCLAQMPKVSAQVADTSFNNLYEMDLEALMDLDIYSVSKKVESLFDAPLSASVLSREEIINSGATNIPEALRLVPGIIVRQKTNGNYDVHIRGNDNVLGNKLNYSENTLSLVMIDNRIVYNSFQGGTFWETLPIGIDEIERIEVVRGPSSALYGPNAVTGVIHIITRRPDQNKAVSATADLQIGTLNTKLASASVGFAPSEKFQVQVSGNYQFRDRTRDDYYSFDLQEYLTRDALGTTMQPDNPALPLLSDPDKYYPNPSTALDTYSGNFSAWYDPNEDVNLRLTAGLQESEAQTIYLDNGAVPMNTRQSNTQYMNLTGNVYGFDARVSYMGGEQNLFLGATSPHFHYDMTQLDAVLEYNYIWKNLTIRPGVSYQKATYDVSPYSDSTNLGFFEGEKELSTLAFQLRAEYLLFDKLKLVAALRADNYDVPDDSYFSYQFATSYKIDDNNLLRLVYSRANQGPIILDNYTSMIIDPGFYRFELYGNENLNLVTSDMFEFGTRNKLTDWLQSDIEVFYSVTKDYSLPLMESMTVDTLTLPFPPFEEYTKTTSVFRYRNIPLKAHQFGLTGSLKLIAGQNLQFKGFGTVQLTALDNLDTKVNHEMYGYMQSYPSQIDLKHESTPTFYGGFMVNYTPIQKLNLFANLYYYSDQVFRYDDASTGHVEEISIDSKTIVDFKASFKVYKENAVFINARNLLGSESKEFAFGDDTKGLYLIGLNLNF